MNAPHTIGTGGIDASRYNDNGFLCPIDVLSPEEAAAHRSALEALERDFEGQLPKPVGHYLRLSAHVATDLPLKIARDPRVLDAVEILLGPDLMLWSCEYFIKEAHSSKIVSWHQDLTYWGMDGSDHEVTAWIAISAATEASGCMRFVPGSHTQQIVPHSDTFAADNLLSRGQEIAVDVDEARAVFAEIQPGQMSLHHGRLFHASGPNTTDDRRIALVLRFIRPDTPAMGAARDYAVLVRGADRTGNRINMVPGSGNFTPRQMQLYQEVTGAQEDVLADGLAPEAALYDTAEPNDA
ncbi:MAG: phytanoyl-CoA dioxygenase family protein [Pseudomonadota bacterium]